jgi:TPR repeat protein
MVDLDGATPNGIHSERVRHKGRSVEFFYFGFCVRSEREKRSCLEMGILMVKGDGGAEDPKFARFAFLKACEVDNAEACHLGDLMLLEGLGGEKDVGRAHALKEKACTLGRKSSCS